jgi:hypothetical protein
MRAFFIACGVAAVIALCGWGILSAVQEPVDVAYATSSVRI